MRHSYPLFIAGGSGDEPAAVKNVQLSEETQADFLAKIATMLQGQEAAAEDAPAEIAEREQPADGETAEMHAALLSSVKLGSLAGQLDKMLFNLPVGTVLVGGVPALVLTEITDGFVAPRNGDGSVNYTNVAAKGVEAYLMTSRMAKNLLGDKAATFAAAAITIQALAAVLPIDIWVDGLVALLTRRSAPASNRMGNVLQQADQIIYGSDHYGAAL